MRDATPIDVDIVDHELAVTIHSITLLCLARFVKGECEHLRYTVYLSHIEILAIEEEFVSSLTVCVCVFVCLYIDYILCIWDY